MALLWLMADILAVTAVGALLTELLSPLLAIFLQCVWWFLSLSATRLTGDVQRFGLQIRHNSLGNLAVWQSQWDIFVCNRLALIALAVLSLVLTVWLYERKRKGGLAWLNRLKAGRRGADGKRAVRDGKETV